MKNILLTGEEILNGYLTVTHLYPYLPSILIWRSWEYAAYQKCALAEPVLDIGCGDGNFFRLMWPGLRDVVGIDIDPRVAEAAGISGVYRDVRVSAADRLPFASETFASAFANCSLEHMDNLQDVLHEVNRSLYPGGVFVMSVVTDKFIDWDILPLLIKILGDPARAASMKSAYMSYHHLVSPLTVDSWVNHLEDAGFVVEAHVPIVPELTGRFFLLLDHLWHIPHEKGDLGNLLTGFVSGLPNFSDGLERILHSILKMEKDMQTCCGAVFSARKVEGGKSR